MTIAPLRRIRRIALALGLAVLVALVDLAGLLDGVDRMLLDWRFRVLSHRANPALVVVDIDPRSINAIGAWPFPRDRHAAVIDRLIAAGALRVAFDVDFSTPADAAADAALGDAVRRAAGRIILPVFVQSAAAAGGVVENRPPVPLAAAAQLAAINIAAESDGRVWRYPIAAELPGGFLPSMAARLAGTALHRQPSFLIDYAVAAGSFARLSYVDVLEGRLDRARIDGRPVIVGATALELGDHRAVPAAGILPSVLVQALAHESIVSGRMLQRSGPAVTVFGLLALAVLVSWRHGRGPSAWIEDAALTAVLATGVIATGLVVQAAAPLAVDGAAWLTMLAAWLVVAMVARVEALEGLVRRRRRAMLRTRSLVDAVVADSFDGVLVVDAAGRVEFANPAAAAMLGVARAALVGRPFAASWPAAAALAEGGQRRMEIQHRRPDGALIVLDVVANESSRPVADPRDRGAGAARVLLVNFRDVTERHRSRTALALAHERAEQASRLKSQFLATMSHELRTPLNAIMGFSELIRDGHFGGDVARYRQYAADIHMSGEHLLQVINDILDLSRIEVGQLEIRRELVDLGRVLESSATMVRDIAQRQQITLAVAPPPPGAGLVVADALRMRQIVLNLLSNAIKFTPSPGRVSAGVTRDPAGNVVIEVADTGIGMSPEEVAIALQPFRQVDSRLERRFGGAGLGLPIAKALAELQGATLDIDSAPGRGTRVRVTIAGARIDRAVA